jgi:hypothetical protein
MAIRAMPSQLEGMPAPCTISKNYVSLGYSKWWLAPPMERLLVLDLATGPWLSVGRISICDSAALKASRFRASTMGWDELWHSHDNNKQ